MKGVNMAKALKVKVKTKAVDTIVGGSEMVISLVHEKSGTPYTARIPTRNDRVAVDELLLGVFKCDGWSVFE